MAKLASKTYGEALFELAQENNKLGDTKEEVKSIKTALDENIELIKILGHPKIDKEEKLSLVEKIFKGKISDDLCGFLLIMVEKDRYNEIINAFDYFIDKVNEYQKIGVAYVTSAIELSKDKKRQIEQKLISTTEYKSFDIYYTVDKSIIGGLIIRIGDRVVDSSIKTKLDLISKKLNKLQIL